MVVCPLFKRNSPVDDFVQMLLSFPVDATSDTIELIQEQAYANSTTIDGRRFASEFISRRKIDVKGPSHTSTDPSSKMTSLADGNALFLPSGRIGLIRIDSSESATETCFPRVGVQGG